MRNEKKQLKKSRIKQGDTVRILLGKDRGKKAKVMAVLPEKERVIVDGVNMVKKHIRPRKSGEKGQRVSVAAPMQISNVQLVCLACKKGTRIGVKRQNGERQRICKKCEAEI